MKKSDEILTLATKCKDYYKQWRWGQCVFNAAYELYPNEADRLRATKIDCFHIDKNVQKFLAEIDKL
jgi:hypothetical protein